MTLIITKHVMLVKAINLKISIKKNYPTFNICKWCGYIIQEVCNGWLRRHAFSQRIIDDWNSLTEKIVNSESLDIFKGRLDKHRSIEWLKISTE